MTTIVVYKGIMACDSRYGFSEEGQLLTDHCEKIYINNDIILAGAGAGGECDAFMREDFSFLDWDNPIFPQKWVKRYLKHITVLMYRKGEKHMLMTAEGRYPDPVPFDKEPIAIGSGANFAKSAAHALMHYSDLTPKEIAVASVEAAIEFDLHSGGEVKTQNIKRFRKVLRTFPEKLSKKCKKCDL